MYLMKRGADPKLVEGFFVGLSENKKGYVIADS